MPTKFEMGGEPVDLETLPEREATELERRKMYGSLPFLYEMKVPLLLCVDTGKFYPIDWQKDPGEFNVGRELVILQSDRILPSIVRKKRNPKQIWR